MANFFASTLMSRPVGAPGSNPMSWASLFETDAPRTPEGWTVPEAFVAVLFAAVTCDGEIATLEYEELLALVHRSRALKTLSPQVLAEINTKVAARLREDDGALGDACAALPKEMRPSVLAHALDLILADGELTLDEADFLDALILELGVEHEQVAQIADVMALKNRY